jgi:hypothetical protein
MLVKRALDAADIKPALDAQKIGATFYRRSQVEALRGDNLRIGPWNLS